MDTALIEAVALALAAGAAIILGAGLGAVERLAPAWLRMEFRHALAAFGGGILLAAVAFVLVPHGTETLAIAPALIALLAGGGLFLLIDKRLQDSGARLAQFSAMLLDFIPEALALGALLASGAPSAALLAVIIALQNLPEGFNAYRELRGPGLKLGRTASLAALAGCALLGPAAASIGYLVLSDAPQAMAALMLTAAGGVLYLTFQDIAPQVPLENAWAPPLGAVAGFALGVGAHAVLS